MAASTIIERMVLLCAVIAPVSSDLADLGVAMSVDDACGASSEECSVSLSLRHMRGEVTQQAAPLRNEVGSQGLEGVDGSSRRRTSDLSEDSHEHLSLGEAQSDLSTVCKDVGVPSVSGGAFVCQPTGSTRWPLIVFGHGDALHPTMYLSLLRQLASFGFAVAAYNSCLFSGLSSVCSRGEASFLEALKLIEFFHEQPNSAVPVDTTAKVTVVGHSTGARVALMVAAVKDNPEYLKKTEFAAALDADNQALRKAAARIGAVVAMNPDPMSDPEQNPDVEDFHGAISNTPFFVVTNTHDSFEPKGSAWWDFGAVRSRDKIWGDFQSFAGHMDPIYPHVAGTWAARFGLAFAVGDGHSRELLYGDCAECMRKAAKFGEPGDGNLGDGKVGLLLCSTTSAWPAVYQEYCKPFFANSAA